MKEIFIASRNEHKAQEIMAVLGAAFQCRTLRDCASAPEVVEDANTFAGNARKKAAALASWLEQNPRATAGKDGKELAEVYVLADDSGLEVDVLNGAPGVYSARFAAMDHGGTGNSTDAENNAKLLRLLADVPPEKRTARFRCVMALVRLGKQAAAPVVFDGVCEGMIGFEPRGKGGFGYDPLFMPVGHALSFAELGEEVKNTMSHRAKALLKLKEFLACV
jgi:XTP/dITP diphosphohydrolase